MHFQVMIIGSTKVWQRHGRPSDKGQKLYNIVQVELIITIQEFYSREKQLAPNLTDTPRSEKVRYTMALHESGRFRPLSLCVTFQREFIDLKADEYFALKKVRTKSYNHGIYFIFSRIFLTFYRNALKQVS